MLHILDVATGKLTNARRAIGLSVGHPPGGGGDFNGDYDFAGLTSGRTFSLDIVFRALALEVPNAGPGLGDAFTFIVSEAAQGNIDLNGDGDTDDNVIHATRLTDRDRNGRLDFAEAR